MQDSSISPRVVLHLEDDLTIQRGMQRIIRKKFGSDVRVISVLSVEEGLKELGNCTAVISDWNVEGGRKGGDLFQEAKKAHPHLMEHYLFVTDSRDAKMFCEENNIPLLEKPAGAEEISTAVASLLVRG